MTASLGMVDADDLQEPVGSAVRAAGARA